MHRDAQGGAGMHRVAQGCHGFPGWCTDAQGGAQGCHGCTGMPGMRRDAQGCAGMPRMHRDAQGCHGFPGWRTDAQGGAQGCHGCAGMRRDATDAQGCTGMHRDAQGCTGLPIALLGPGDIPGGVEGRSPRFDETFATAMGPETIGHRAKRGGLLPQVSMTDDKSFR